MSGRCIANECLGTTGFSYTLSLINGKYKMTILYTLMEFGVVRFNEMKKYIGSISYKTLSATLKELENVIGVAAGSHKVDAIRAVLRGKYLDVLITDEATALQLLGRQGS